MGTLRKDLGNGPQCGTVAGLPLAQAAHLYDNSSQEEKKRVVYVRRKEG
jgi:hypothetical protein